MRSYLPAGLGCGGDLPKLKTGEAVLWGWQGVRLQQGDLGDWAGVQATQSWRVGRTGLAGNANEDASGFAPRLGNSVSVGGTNTSGVYFISELRLQKH